VLDVDKVLTIPEITDEALLSYRVSEGDILPSNMAKCNWSHLSNEAVMKYSTWTHENNRTHLQIWNPRGRTSYCRCLGSCSCRAL